ncbi:DinB family protein [Aggregatilinea lenta]|uniref:DinB family protein n=1 Tax=Aggregatilinea lenta TaxID=913108 RepID=UPI000E5BAB34|nr:DinB family protein [Aggregatilinea lenta]
MAHPLVMQLRFTRSEFARCMEGVSAEDAVKRLGPMNCLSWMVGHLASQEQAYWVLMAQDKTVVRDLHKLVGSGKPASTPPLDEMWDAWRTITAAADEFLDTVTTAHLSERLFWMGEPRTETIGTMLLRNIYHYWFHTGESHAIRQQLGHTDLPEFVGSFPPEMVYHPEA